MIKTKEVNEIRTEADVIICDSCGKEIRKNKFINSQILISLFGTGVEKTICVDVFPQC